MRKRNLSRNQLAAIRTRFAYIRTILAAATLAVASIAAVASVAHSAELTTTVQTDWNGGPVIAWRACDNTGCNGSYVAVCATRAAAIDGADSCERMICKITAQKETCDAVPLPRARPAAADNMGPCDTDPDDYCDSFHAPDPTVVNRLRALMD